VVGGIERLVARGLAHGHERKQDHRGRAESGGAARSTRRLVFTLRFPLTADEEAARIIELLAKADLVDTPVAKAYALRLIRDPPEQLRERLVAADRAEVVAVRPRRVIAGESFVVEVAEDREVDEDRGLLRIAVFERALGELEEHVRSR